MRYAAIDIGSNTIQLLIAEVTNQRFIWRENDLATTKLGQSKRLRHLEPAAIARSAQVIAGFMDKITAAGVQHCRLIATSAVRDADNSTQLCAAVRKLCPAAPDIEIVSGEQEAELSYLGACVSLPQQVDWPVLDTGGSSSELIFTQAGQRQAFSANVGAVRVLNNGWSRAEIKQRLAAVYPPLNAAGIIGVGGVITTAAALKLELPAYQREPLEGLLLTYDDLASLETRLSAIPREQRCAASPLLAQRGEIMVEGLWIWLSVLELLGAQQVIVTGGGLLDGAIAQLADVKK